MGTFSGGTQPAPGNDGPRVSCGDALQNSRLMNIDGQILGTRQDDWLLVDSGSSTWMDQDETQLFFSP